MLGCLRAGNQCDCYFCIPLLHPTVWDARPGKWDVHPTFRSASHFRDKPVIWSMSIHKQPCKAACKQPCETPCGHAQDTRAIRTAPTRESPENATARSSPSHGHRTRTRTPQPQPAHRHQKTPATATTPPTGTERSWGCSPLTYIQSKNPQVLFGELPCGVGSK